MSLRQIIGGLLVLISLGLLYPGLTQEMLTISASFKFLGFEKEVLNQSRSVLGTVQELWESKNQFVAGLIFLFSVAVPVLKAILVGSALTLSPRKSAQNIFKFVQAISKWSMADVFVVAIFVAFLSVEGMANINAQIQPGFYWFTGYCLTSLLSIQVLKFEAK